MIEPVVDDEEIEEVSKVLRSGWLTEEPKTKAFENEVKSYVARALIKRRIELANNYNEVLRAKEFIRIPERKKEAKHIYQTYAVYIKKARALYSALMREENFT